MTISYLMSENEFDLLYAMATETLWQGKEELFTETMNKLIKKGFVTDSGREYLIDQVIFRLMKILAETPESKIICNNEEKLYQNESLWIFVQRDSHIKNGLRVCLYPNEKAFCGSNEGISFLRQVSNG